MEKVLDLILAEQRETRKDVKKLNEKIHKIDLKVTGNKFKIGTVLSALSIAWAVVINYVNKKFLN